MPTGTDGNGLSATLGARPATRGPAPLNPRAAPFVDPRPLRLPMKLLLRWAASAAALLLVAYLIPSVVVDGVGTAFVAALVVGLVNATVGAVVRLITTPLRWLTLGLFTTVINAAMFWLATVVVDGFETTGALATLLASLTYGVLAALIGRVIGARS